MAAKAAFGSHFFLLTGAPGASSGSSDGERDMVGIGDEKGGLDELDPAEVVE